MDNEENKFDITQDIIDDLPLINVHLFNYAASKNLEFADFLIKPVMDYFGYQNYNIISAETEVDEDHFNQHGVRLDLLVKTDDGKDIIVEVQNTHPERMTLKRLRYIHSSHDIKRLPKGADYSELNESIVICYTDQPLRELDKGTPVTVLAETDLIDGELVKTGRYSVIVNNKYKDPNFQQFTDVIEDLYKKNAKENIKNPIAREIHLTVKPPQKGGKSELQDYIEELFETREATLIQKNKELTELHEEDEKKLKQKDEEISRLKQKDEEILRLKQIIKQAGLAIE